MVICVLSLVWLAMYKQLIKFCVQHRKSHDVVGVTVFHSLSSANEIIEEAEQFMSEDLTSTDDDVLSERFRHQSWTRDTSSPISQLSKRQNGFCGLASYKFPTVANETEASAACEISADNENTDQVFEDQLPSGGFLCQNYIDGEFV